MATPKRSVPARGLTAAGIAALAPDVERFEVPDRRCPGLRLRVHPSGSRVFIWRCTSRRRVIAIGPWSMDERPAHVTLASARLWIERLKAGHVAGDGALARVEAELTDHLQRRERIADAAPADRHLLRAVAKEWLTDDIEKSRKRPEYVRALLDNDVIPALGDRSVEAISTLDCRAVVLAVVKRGAATTAGRVLSVLKQFFGWCQASGLTQANPAAPLKGRHLGVVESRRERWLTAEEIPIFWRALDAASTADRPAQQKLRPATAMGLKVLLLTGVRSGALLKARWENVDLDARTWTIPPRDQKLTKAAERRARPFVIPLGPTSVELFKELRTQAHGSPWVMAGRQKEKGGGKERPYSEKTLIQALTRLEKQGVLVLPGGPVRPHDARRTMRSHLSDLRVPYEVKERCLGHKLSGMTDVYDRSDFLEERRDALARWDSYVHGLLDREDAKVIPLPVEESR